MRFFAFLTATAVCCAIFSGPAEAAREAKNIATPAISADGRTVYFSCWGDIWSAPSDGSGHARRLSDNVAHEERPMPSPDGSRIAFMSDRFGSYDIFTMPEQGGEASRLTWESIQNYPYAWRPDGMAVIEYSNRQDLWGTALYEVPLDGSEARRLSGPDHDDHHFGSWIGNTRKMVYARGPGDWAPKKYRGTYSYDIYVYDPETKKHTALTDHPGKDLWPQTPPDASKVYYVSDRDGTENLWAHDFASGKLTQITHFKVDGVRWPRISSDGDEMAFEVFGELYVMSLPSGQPRKVEISFADDPKRELQLTRDIRDDAGEMALSPNGSYFALTVLGDVYVLKNPDRYKEEEKPEQDLSRTHSVVTTAGREMQLTWHYKNTKLAYLSDRDGQFDVYVLDLQTMKETQVTSTPFDEFMPKFAPWGDKLAYYSGPRKLCLYDLASGNEEVLYEGDLRAFAEALGYSWSPDARWIAFGQYLSKRDDLTAIFVISLETREAINVTRTPDWCSDAVWSPDGKYLAFVREGYYYESVQRGTDVMMIELYPEIGTFDIELLFPEDMPQAPLPVDPNAPPLPPAEPPAEPADPGAPVEPPLEPPVEPPLDPDAQAAAAAEPAAPADPEEAPAAEDEKKEEDKQPDPIKIDFERIHLRAEQISDTPGSAASPLFSPDSKYLVYMSDHEGEGSIYSIKLDDRSRANLAPAEGKSDPQWFEGGRRLYFLDMGAIAYLDIAEGRAAGGGRVAATSNITTDQYAMWDQMLVEGWRYLKEYFYDPTMNNTDWNDVLARYRARVPELGTRDEYSRLYREMLGELGRSHMGFSGHGNHREAPPETTASFGVLFSEDFPGPGWHVRKVLHDGPADIAGSRLYAGDIILAVNDEKVRDNQSRARQLRNMSGQPTKLLVKSSPEAKAALLAAEPDIVPTDERTVVIKPIPLSANAALEYEDWVLENKAAVDKLSGGRIAYQHIQSMDEDSLIRFRNELLTDTFDKDALILDVRFNGGGFTSVAIMEILERQAAYTRFRRETGEVSYARQQVWDGPVVLLINAHSFSNAEILAHVFKDLGIATLIGETTGGNVISTGGKQLMDGFVRLPGIGNARLDGTDMEGHGAEPDIAVDIDPYLLTKGRDNQIEAAVTHLLGELEE